MTKQNKEPRIFYIWPKRKDSFFGETMSIEDYNAAINEHCKDNAFKVIEYSAYEEVSNLYYNIVLSMQEYFNKIENLKKTNKILKDELNSIHTGVTEDYRNL